MKRPVIILIVILVILLILPAWSFFRWVFQPRIPMNMLVINKTVPDLKKDEHRSFFWVLNNLRVVKNEKQRMYRYKKDYFGFKPQKPLRNKQYDITRVRFSEIINLAEANDAIYITDTYGVYFNDWYKGINRSRRSRMIYGGLNNSDYLLMKEMNDRKKLVIAEYNILGSPTPPLERNKTEELLNVQWTEWTGKYFSSLDTLKKPDFPKWILESYRKQYRKEWDFTRAGIVFVAGANKVVVLENQTHLEFDAPYIITRKDGTDKYGVPHKIAYSNWFEIVETRDNEVVSWFKIYPSELGDSIMAENFIPTMFPAVVTSPDDHNYYYFAGNFANNPVGFCSSHFRGFNKLNFINLRSDYRTTHNFFWRYYEPMMKRILLDYHGETEAND